MLSLLSPRQVRMHWFTDPHIPWKVPLRCLQVFAAPTEAISNGNARTLFISQKNNRSKDMASGDLLCMRIYIYSLCTYRLSRWQVGGRRRRPKRWRDLPTPHSGEGSVRSRSLQNRLERPPWATDSIDKLRRAFIWCRSDSVSGGVDAELLGRWSASCGN